MRILTVEQIDKKMFRYVIKENGVVVEKYKPLPIPPGKNWKKGTIFAAYDLVLKALDNSLWSDVKETPAVIAMSQFIDWITRNIEPEDLFAQMLLNVGEEEKDNEENKEGLN